MKYSFLGQTGVQVSKLTLGTATFGVAPLEEDVDQLVGRALDLGINFFDTANSYGNQKRFDRPGSLPSAQRKSAEEMLGSALQGHRDEVIIASKVMEQVGFGPNNGGMTGGGLSRVHIMGQVEQTLRRLQTDHLDVYYMHHPDPTTPIEQTLRTFDDLIRQGKVRYCAFSTFDGWRMMEALWMAERYGLNAPVCHQTAYNLLSRGIERDIVPASLKYGLTLNLFSPLGGGLLASPAVLERTVTGSQRWGGPGFSEEDIANARQFYVVANEVGQSPAHLALAWLLSRPAVSSAIIGPETIEELEMNAGVGDLELDDDLMNKVDEIGRLPPRPAPRSPI